MGNMLGTGAANGVSTSGLLLFDERLAMAVSTQITITPQGLLWQCALAMVQRPPPS